MFHIEDVLQLKDDEQVKLIVRRHLVTLFPSLFLALILIVVPFFMLFPLFAWGILGVILFAVAVFCGVVVAGRSVLLWDADLLIVTNFRLVDVDQRGLFTRLVSEVALPSIVDVAWSRKGLLETFFRMGSLAAQTGAAGTKIEARMIPRPERTAEFLNDLRRDIQQVKHVAQPTVPLYPATDDHAARLKRICGLLEKYSPDELVRIENVLKARERSAVAEAFFAQDGKLEE
ncbi:MAG: hypothetical protein WC641_07170 [Patescibacteria group bacterium]